MTWKDFSAQKVAVVSHNYNVLNRYGHQDFSEHFSQINMTCDNQGCDTVLYSLFTWDEKSPAPRNHKNIFKGLKNVKCVILEVGNKKSVRKFVEIWLADDQKPLVVEQYFAKSSESYRLKRDFVNDVKTRVFGNSILVICGESNIVSYVPNDGSFKDPFEFNQILKKQKVKFVFNPLHDYMTRYEMKKKRGYLSENRRAVITVWNKGKKKGEALIPWTFFYNDQDMTEKVQELETPIKGRPDIRIGIIPVV